jgi:isopentenyl diphosphate isomerase/L-lactate dehydrogenase-like FMN-dependent dehydrogenase
MSRDLAHLARIHDALPGRTIVVYDTGTPTPDDTAAALAVGIDAYLARATPADLVTRIDSL